MTIFRKSLPRALAIIVVIAVVAIVGSILQSINVQRKAERFLAKANQLTVGSSTYGQTVNMLQEFHSYEASYGPCSPVKCELEYRFDNIGVRALKITPPTGFYFSLEFRDGLLVGKRAVLGQGICCVALVQEVKFSPAKSIQTPSYELIPNGAPYKVIVKLDTRATAEERNAAYEFNLGCLTTLGGCKDAHQLLPSVWRQN